ncbi:hypothetical protein [Bradyrhizobium sp. AUGA SZCCT0283]|uniref:hypothetical protein n=1 Tax=Bradyrhizobium sp. AUGA SZCCT0283 TaxID=2807671 RepID=UPI001BA9AA6D|nr:hypothetical protein [Bradyrhizobium sp. AUGA SZCCT0283]MBR1274267.1 hypothetical protein [Bradyrhizobium sp. AUGA SZCCT0283]
MKHARHLLLIMSVSVLMCAKGVTAEIDCSALPIEQPSVNVTDELEKPSDFVFSTSEDQTELYFAGDVIVIDAENFPFFFPPDNLAVPTVRSITFEARRIIVSAPLRFRDASIQLIADEITIRGRGSLGITEFAKSDVRSIKILGKVLDLTRSDLLPFATYTRDWKSPEPKVQHRISIHVGTILLPPKAQAPTYDLSRESRLVHNLSLDFGKSRAEGWEDAYDVSLGSNALSEYEGLVVDKLIWPQLTAARIDEIFSTSPYNADVRNSLRIAVDSYLERFSGKRDPTSVLRFQATKNAIAEGLDLRGLSAYDMPMISFKNLLDDFKERKARTLGTGGSLPLWDETISKSKTRFVAEAAPVRALKADEDSALNQVKIADSEIQAAVDSLVGADNRILSILQEIDTRRQAAQAAAAAEARRLKAAGEVEAAGKVLQLVAVAVGTFFPVTAPIALSVGAGLGVSSKAIANHNRGQSFSVEEAAISLSEMTELQKQYSAQIKTLKQAWEGQPDGQDPVSKGGLKGTGAAAVDHVRSGFRKEASALTNASAAAQKFFEAAKDIERSARPPQRAIFRQTAFEKKDARLQELLNELSDLQEQGATLRGKIATSAMAKARAMDALGATRTGLDALLTPRVGDVRENARQLNIAYWYRQRTITELKNRALNLLRSYSYRTGAPLELPVTMRQSFSPRLSDATSLNMLLAGQTTERLEESRAQINRMFEGLIASLEYEDLKMKLLGRKTLKFSGLEIAAEASKRSARQQQFVDEINAEIANQVKRKSEPKLIEIPIPVSIGASERPERVVAATVYDAQFEDETALKGIPIRFAISHPGYGVVYHNSKCTFVRGVGVDGKPITPLSWLNNFPAGSNTLQAWSKSVETTAEELSLTYPFRSLYSLRIEVLGRDQIDPSLAPTLKSISVAIAGDEGVDAKFVPR